MDKKQAFLLYMRNFIFGAEDSLISTVGLLAGIASVGMHTKDVIVSGIILIFVEAFSMSVGSFLSETATEEADSHFIKGKSKSLGASIVMFISYIVCGLIPLIPYIIFNRAQALPLSILFSLAALFALGIVSSKILRTRMFHNAARMLILGGLAIVLGVAVGSIVSI